jgi:cell division septation protein DedD
VAALPYWVQVGAYKNAVTARRFAASLREGLARVSTPPVRATEGKPQQLLSRVLVGPFAARAAAVAKRRELQARGYEAFITREAD